MAVTAPCPGAETLEGNGNVQQGNGAGRRRRQPGPEEGKGEEKKSRGATGGCSPRQAAETPHPAAEMTQERRNTFPFSGDAARADGGGWGWGGCWRAGLQRAATNPPPAPGRAGAPAQGSRQRRRVPGRAAGRGAGSVLAELLVELVLVGEAGARCRGGHVRAARGSAPLGHGAGRPGRAGTGRAAALLGGLPPGSAGRRGLPPAPGSALPAPPCTVTARRGGEGG